MARVLVCADGFFRAFSPFGLEPYIESFINVLARHGNRVMPYICQDFEHRKPWKRKVYSWQAVQEVKKFDPEIVFAFNNAFNPSFFKQFHCPVYIIASDTPIYWRNKDLLKENSDLYSVCYFNADMAATLKDEYHIPLERQLLIPYSTDMRCDETKPFNKDISFIGNFYFLGQSLFDIFFSHLSVYPNEMRQKIKTLVVSMIDELQCSKMKNEKTLNLHKQLTVLLNRNYDYDWIVSEIFGALTSEQRIECLLALTDMDLHIYTWSQNFRCISNYYSLFRKCHLESVYSIEANQNIYNESKISLSLPHAQVNTGFSWRVCDIMASNSMLISNPSKDLIRLFDGIVPTFDSARELKDKCQYFLKNEAERTDVVKACQKMIDKNHRYENVFKIIEEYSGIKLLNTGVAQAVEQFSRTKKKQKRWLRSIGK